MGSLSNLYISASYTSLVHLGNDGPITALAPGQFVALQDGLGNSLKIELNNSGDVNVGGILSASNIPTDIATQAELNAYTQSTNIRLNNIESTTASLNISVTNLNASSASQQVSINSLNAFTASQSTASINTSITNLNQFTSSQISFNNSATASIVALQNFSSSLDSNFVTEAELAAATASLITQINTKLDSASFNSYTSSNNQRVNSLEVNSASVNISISNLNAATSSYANSASVAAVDAAQQQSINSINAVTASFLTSSADISALNAFTASQLNINSGYNSFTSSQQSFNSSATASISQLLSFSSSLDANFVTEAELAAATGSLINQINTKLDTASFNSYTASQSTASLVTSITNLNSFTQSANVRLNNLETNSASVNVSISNLNSTTSSLVTSVANLNSFTQSQLAVNVILSGEIDSLQAATASYAISSSVAAVDAAQQAQINSLISATSSYADSASFAASQLAQDTRINGLAAQTSSYITESETASFARTNVDNNFTANQTFTNITAVSASFRYLQTLYETASVIYSSGSNQLGDELTDVQTLSGSVLVRGSLRVNGIPVLTSSVDISGLVTTSSFNAYTQSNNQRVSSLEVNSASVNTSITNLNASSASQQVSINALNVFTASQSTASLVTSITNLNTFSASTLVSIANINSTTASLNTSVSNINTATASLFSSASLALVTASFDNGTRNLTFTKGDTTTFAVNIPDASGSILPNGVVSGSQQIIDLGFLQTASFNSYTQSNDSRVSSLESATASLFTSVANINTFTQSANISINALNAATSSYATSAITASSLITASVSSSTITFTKGDASTFNITLPTASVATINTGSFATTGSNTFRGRQTISSSLTVLGDNTNDIYLFRGGVLNTADGIAITPNNIVAYSRQIEIISPDATLKLSPTLGNSNISFDTRGGLNHDIMGISGVTTNNSASLQISQANQGLIIAEYGPLKQTRFYNKVDISGSISITGSLSASLNQGYVWVGNGGNRTVLLSTSSFATDISGLTTTASFNAYTQSNDSRVSNLEVTTASLLIETQNLESFSASALISISNLNGKTGSYATTGSNVFTGSQTFADSGSNSMTLHSVSGSLGYTIGNIDNFFNVSASFQTANPNARVGGNLLFKNVANASGSLVISGSGNLVMAMPNVNTDFRAQLTSNNLAFGLPQISASMAYPISIANNIIQTAPSFRGPISSSAWTIGNNYLAAQVNLGPSVPQNFEKAIAGVTLNSNIINGAISATANSASFNTAFSIANSNINQTLTINAISSSVQIANSNMGGLSATINNRASSSLATNTNNFLTVSSVLTSGQSITINADGASTTNVSPGLVASFVGGTSPTIQLGAPGVTSDSRQLRNTIVFGQQLIVTGSNSAAATAAQGGAFLGRFNSATPNQNDSSYVVFAVGTGNGNLNRKTAFLIDSGSNTFVEGALNVSGSTFLNGATIITGSLVISSSAATELTVIGDSIFTGSLTVTGSSVIVRFPSFDTTNGRVRDSLSFTGSVSASTDMGILTPAQFGFNQNAIGDGNTGAQFVIETNKGSGFTELKLNARYTGSANAQIGIRNAAGVRTATIDADTTTVNGSLTIQSGSSFFANGNKQFNVGAFQSDINQSGSANVSQSMNFEVTDISEGVSIASNSRITLANSGTYNIQFSAQTLADTGADNVYIWLMKNGTNVPATAGHVVLANNEELIASWNYVVNAAAGDYYELVWQSSDGDAILLAEPASGNIPSIPSVILTVTQVR